MNGAWGALSSGCGQSWVSSLVDPQADLLDRTTWAIIAEQRVMIDDNYISL